MCDYGWNGKDMNTPRARTTPTLQTDENVGPRTERIDDAIQYAIAFMNDPEGLASSREEWRDQLRTALHDFRAIEREASSPAIDVERLRQALHAVYGDHDFRTDAPLIAAEYARLSTPEPPA